MTSRLEPMPHEKLVDIHFPQAPRKNRALRAAQRMAIRSAVSEIRAVAEGGRDRIRAAATDRGQRSHRASAHSHEAFSASTFLAEATRRIASRVKNRSSGDAPDGADSGATKPVSSAGEKEHQSICTACTSMSEITTIREQTAAG